MFDWRCYEASPARWNGFDRDVEKWRAMHGGARTVARQHPMDSTDRPWCVSDADPVLFKMYRPAIDADGDTRAYLWALHQLKFGDNARA